MAELQGAAGLAALFARARSENRAVLLPFMTAGLPNPDDSVELFAAMAEAGADGFEIGIPYSDPLMDGPTIHAAGLQALAAGTSLERGLEIVARVGERTGKPTIVMTYSNPVLRIGIDDFAARCAEAGAAAVIVVDVPGDEAQPFRAAFDRKGLGTVLFVAPTTGADRLATLAATRPAFIYGIADLGVTGERTEASPRAAELAARVREATDVPLVLGVGISTPEHAASAARIADGVIVGSALVRRVLDAPDAAIARSELVAAVADLATAVRR